MTMTIGGDEVLQAVNEEGLASHMRWVRFKLRGMKMKEQFAYLQALYDLGLITASDANSMGSHMHATAHVGARNLFGGNSWGGDG